ncbi:MAG TPA: tetratricopeptide repeat protein [Blastocatellia bacterium]|nr:tetratricopeptide repeat protein [Blastocatellia bacterium]
MSKQRTSIVRGLFTEIVSRKDEEINLAEAALTIAAEEYPRLDIPLYLDKLDRIGDMARERARDAINSLDQISALNAVLFEELGFRGNRGNYYDPRNSFLNEVIDRRTGIPITLTVVYIEVARRIGLFIEGVGMPSHFIARHEAATGDVFIDVFNSGRLMGEMGCAEMLAEMSNGKFALRPEHLAAVTKKQILARMLANLLGIYSSSDNHRALAVIERLMIINPDSPQHVRDYGLLLAATGDTSNSIEELERYLALLPDAPDRKTIREQIKAIRQSQARLN